MKLTNLQKKTSIFTLLFFAFSLFWSHLNVFALMPICDDVVVLFGRGSEQTQNNLEDQPQTQKFFNEIEEQVPKNVKLRTEEVHYPAAGGWNHFANGEWSWFGLGNYRSSVSEGIVDVKTKIEIEALRCPETKFILGGYSQGAHVVGDALFELSDEAVSRIVYVGLFGDPKFRTDSFAARGNFNQSPYPSLRASGGILEPREEFPSQFNGKLSSWCRKDDGVCENNLHKAKFLPEPHTDSYQHHEIPLAVNLAVARLGDALGFNSQLQNHAVYGEKLDLVFAVDASRWHHTHDTQGRGYNYFLENITEKTQLLSNDPRIGLTTYYGHAGEGEVVTENRTPLTDDLEAWQVGYDARPRPIWREAPVWGGLMTSLSQDWRDDARKMIILSPFVHPSTEPEFGTGLVVDDVIAAARNAHVSVYPVIKGGASAPSHEVVALYQRLADATGGVLLTKQSGFSSDGHAVSLLLNGMAAHPNGYYGKSLEGRPEEEVVHRIGNLPAMTEEDIYYRWFVPNTDNRDFIVTHEPYLRHVYPTELQAAVKVEIRRVERNRYVDSFLLPVDVSYSHQLPQIADPPQNVRIKIIERSSRVAAALKTFAVSGLAQNHHPTQTIELSWDPPVDHGGTPQGYKIWTAAGDLLGIATPDQTSVIVTDVPLAADLRLQVATMNEAGASRPEPVQTITDESAVPDPVEAPEEGDLNPDRGGPVRVPPIQETDTADRDEDDDEDMQPAEQARHNHTPPRSLALPGVVRRTGAALRAVSSVAARQGLSIANAPHQQDTPARTAAGSADERGVLAAAACNGRYCEAYSSIFVGLLIITGLALLAVLVRKFAVERA